MNCILVVSYVCINPSTWVKCLQTTLALLDDYVELKGGYNTQPSALHWIRLPTDNIHIHHSHINFHGSFLPWVFFFSSFMLLDFFELPH